MRFLTIGAVGLLLASGTSIASAEEFSPNRVAPGSVQGGGGAAGAGQAASQAPYVVPIEIREILEQRAAIEAAAAANSPPASLPQMSAPANN